MFGYISLLLSQAGMTGKQYAMKKCGERAPGAFNSVCINAARAVICLAVSLVIWLASGASSADFRGSAVAFTSGIGTALTLFSWIIAANLVPLILIECLSMIGSMLIPMLLAPYIYGGESVSVFGWVGAALVFVSVLLFANRSSGEREKSTFAYKAVMVSICTLGTALSCVLRKYYTVRFASTGEGTIEYFTLISFATVLLCFAILLGVFYPIEKRRLGASPEPVLTLKRTWTFILTASVLLYVNEFFATYAAQLPSEMYFPLSRALALIATFALDVIVFKERISPKKLAGLAVVIIAIILVNL